MKMIVGSDSASSGAAAQRYFDANRADVVVVGDAQHFYDGLRRLRPNAERISASELNLDSESLH